MAIERLYQAQYRIVYGLYGPSRGVHSTVVVPGAPYNLVD